MMPSSEAELTPTLVNLYHICRRQAWLHARGVRMEHTSEAVADGRWLHQHSYRKRARIYRELNLGFAKIDFYDSKTHTIHETKRSDRREAAHEAQLKYYLYLMHQAGITEARGMLEYPRLHKTREILLSAEERTNMPHLLQKILHLLHQPNAPARLEPAQCRVCSYQEFCWAEEVEPSPYEL